MVVVNCTPAEANWAEREFEGTQLWDRRCVKSLGRIADLLARSSGCSFSRACGHTLRQSAHRIFSHSSTSVSGLMLGHIAETIQRGQAPETQTGVSPLLIIQDTTDFDYSKHFATEGIGPIGSKQKRGLLAHCGFAVRADGLPLGVVHLDIWARDEQQHGKKQYRQQLPIEQKESYKWIAGLQGIEDAFDPEQPLLIVADREADIYDYLAEPRRSQTHLLVRASYPRKVFVGKEGEPSTLFDAVAACAVLGTYSIKIPRRPALPEREAQEGRVVELQVRSCEMELPASPSATRNSQTSPSVRIWVIQASEAVPSSASEEDSNQPSARQEEGGKPSASASTPVSWTLISTQPISSSAMAWEMVQHYTRRWMVERLHYTLKSGLRAEKLQFDDAQSLTKALALLYIVAWRLLWLLCISRSDPDAPAAVLLEAAGLTVLDAVSRRSVKTAGEAMLEIAKLGGYEYYPAASPPGIKSLWLGLRRLDDIMIGFQLAANRAKS